MKTKNVLLFIGFLASAILLTSCAASEKSTVLDDFISENKNLLVCPVHILSNQESKYDTIISKKIVEYINDKKYAEASLTQLYPTPNNQWQANEAKMLTISINHFIEFVKSNNFPENTFILYPEFLKGGKYLTVIAVHYCLLNCKGEIAMRGLLNSHWEEFQSVNPKTDDDCFKVFVNGFENKIKRK